MHLEKHLKDVGVSQGDFGKKLNPPASQGLVSQWIRGITRITLDYALQIDAETHGTVTPQDCADMYIEPAQRSQPRTVTPDHPAERQH